MVGFEINLKEFNLGDVLQFLGRVKKTGMLRVSGGISGTIYLEEGVVIHAEDGVDKGMEALLNLSFVPHETGVFELDATTSEHTISEDLGKLTESVEKRRIEYEEIKKRLPPMNTVLAKSTRDLESAVALRRTDWQILALIDGKRSVGDVMTESKIGGYEATKTITWLKDQGLIYDPQEAQRIMGGFIQFLKVFFEEFAENGLIMLKEWAEASEENKHVLDVLEINEETFEVKPVGELTAPELDSAIEHLEAHTAKAGPKLYGKVLFRKKWQTFSRRAEKV